MFKLIYREIKASLKSKTYLLLLLVIPLLISLFIGHILIKTRVPMDLPVAVFDQDSSKISREITNYINSIPGIGIEYRILDLKMGKELFFSGKVRGIIVIPKNFSRQINKGKQARISIYEDFNFLLPGRTIAKSMVILEGWLQQRYFNDFFEKKGASGYSSRALSNLGIVEYHKLFNPNLEYTQFFLPGLLMAILYLVLCVLSAIALFRNHFLYKGVSKYTFLFVKIISHLIISMIPFLLIYGLLFPWFSLLTGNFFQILLLYIPFSLATFLLGMLFSVIIKEPIFTTEIMITIGALSFVISGFTWPVKMFPGFIKFCSTIVPLTEFLDNSLKIWYNTGFNIHVERLWIFVPILLIPVILMIRRVFNEEKH